jgi:disulfide oxidoreductase YuzD
MPKIEIESFFYDLIHCKDKILATFDEFDEKYEEDERGPLVAGMRETPDDKLITLLVNIQRLATGYERIKDLIDEAEQAQVDESMSEEDDDDDEF